MAIWKSIKGYNNQYWVSDEGQVISMNYNKTGKTKILKAGRTGRGYLQVKLCKDGKRYSYLVHRLVAEAFIPNPDNLPQVNHIDKNIHNNSVSNLEFCTAEYNVEYSLAKPVLQYDKEGNLIKEWVSTKEIEKQLGFANTHISNCCNKKKYCNSAYGYVWKYKEERAA